MLNINLGAHKFYAVTQCIAKKDIRHFLTGVFIDAKNKKLVGTDGTKLATCDVGFVSDQNENIILGISGGKWPKPTSKEVTARISYEYGQGRLEYEDKFGNKRAFVLEKIEGTFPDYQRVLPKNSCANSKGLGLNAIGFTFEMFKLVGEVSKTLQSIAKEQVFSCQFYDAASGASLKYEDFELVIMPARIFSSKKT